MLYYLQEDVEGVSAADSVFARVDVLLKACEVVLLEEVHRLPVEPLNALPNLSVVLVVVSEVELLPPMAEVSREDKEGVRVVEVGRKYLAVILCHLLIDWACEYGNYLHAPAKCFYDEGQMHFVAVLVLVIVDVEHVEALFALQLIHHLHVDLQGPQRSAVLIRVG